MTGALRRGRPAAPEAICLRGFEVDDQIRSGIGTELPKRAGRAKSALPG
jgi:hypothetical protein